MGKRIQREILEELACIRDAVFSLVNRNDPDFDEVEPEAKSSSTDSASATIQKPADMGKTGDVNRFKHNGDWWEERKYGAAREKWPLSDGPLHDSSGFFTTPATAKEDVGLNATAKADALRAQFHEELPGGPAIASTTEELPGYGAAMGPSLADQLGGLDTAGIAMLLDRERKSQEREAARQWAEGRPGGEVTGFRSIGEIAAKLAADTEAKRRQQQCAFWAKMVQTFRAGSGLSDDIADDWIEAGLRAVDGSYV